MHICVVTEWGYAEWGMAAETLTPLPFLLYCVPAPSTPTQQGAWRSQLQQQQTPPPAAGQQPLTAMQLQSQHPWQALTGVCVYSTRDRPRL